MAVRFPAIAAEWHPTKNGRVTPDAIAAGTHTKIWWTCAQGPDHVWQTSVVQRTRGGRGCPACAGLQVSVTNSLAARFPIVAGQWHPTKNGRENQCGSALPRLLVNFHIQVSKHGLGADLVGAVAGLWGVLDSLTDAGRAAADNSLRIPLDGGLEAVVAGAELLDGSRRLSDIAVIDPVNLIVWSHTHASYTWNFQKSRWDLSLQLVCKAAGTGTGGCIVF